MYDVMINIVCLGGIGDIPSSRSPPLGGKLKAWFLIALFDQCNQCNYEEPNGYQNFQKLAHRALNNQQRYSYRIFYPQT